MTIGERWTIPEPKESGLDSRDLGWRSDRQHYFSASVLVISNRCRMSYSAVPALKYSNLLKPSNGLVHLTEARIPIAHSKHQILQDPRVKVHFQKCAWADTKTCVNISEAMKSDPVFSEHDPERIFFCDNLDAHCAPDFVNSMKSLGQLVFFPPNLTDLLQPGKPYESHVEICMKVL